MNSFTEVERSFVAGNRVQFTRNERRGARVVGTTGTATAIDRERGTVSVKKARGVEHTLQRDATGTIEMGGGTPCTGAGG